MSHNLLPVKLKKKKRETSPHISAARATTGKAEKWVIYMPTEQPGSNLHASCSAFQPRQQIETRERRRRGGEKAAAGRKTGVDENAVEHERKTCLDAGVVA